MDEIRQDMARSGVFTHAIKVRWADCDPARIAYTGRIPNFALEAIEEWWGSQIGMDWYHGNIDRDIGTPFVHLSVDFRSPVTPRHATTCHNSCENAMRIEPSVDATNPRKKTRAWPYLSPILAASMTKLPNMAR